MLCSYLKNYVFVNGALLVGKRARVPDSQMIFKKFTVFFFRFLKMSSNKETQVQKINVFKTHFTDLYLIYYGSKIAKVPYFQIKFQIYLAFKDIRLLLLFYHIKNPNIWSKLKFNNYHCFFSFMCVFSS